VVAPLDFAKPLGGLNYGALFLQLSGPFVLGLRFSFTHTQPAFAERPVEFKKPASEGLIMAKTMTCGALWGRGSFSSARRTG